MLTSPPLPLQLTAVTMLSARRDELAARVSALQALAAQAQLAVDGRRAELQSLELASRALRWGGGCEAECNSTRCLVVLCDMLPCRASRYAALGAVGRRWFAAGALP